MCPWQCWVKGLTYAWFWQAHSIVYERVLMSRAAWGCVNITELRLPVFPLFHQIILHIIWATHVHNWSQRWQCSWMNQCKSGMKSVTSWNVDPQLFFFSCESTAMLLWVHVFNFSSFEGFIQPSWGTKLARFTSSTEGSSLATSSSSFIFSCTENDLVWTSSSSRALFCH